MSDSRQAFLAAIGAERGDDGHYTPGDARADRHSPDWACVLGNHGLLSVEGADAQRFLQGQLSCDVRPVSTRRAAPGAYCNPKGRVLASFVIAAAADQAYRLRLRHDIAADTCATLSRYVVFSKATVHDVSADWVLLGLWGTQAAAAAADWIGGRPGGLWQVHGDARGQLLQLDAEGLRHELWLPAADAGAAWAQLRRTLPAASSRHWARLDIEQGRAEIHAGNREALLPEMLNYPETGAVSFRKGCYTGQEVIARMHYRGNRKRALFRCQYPGADPAAGDAILTAHERSPAGEVFAAIDGELLAILNTALSPDTALCLAAEPERMLRRAALPYDLELRGGDA